MIEKWRTGYEVVYGIRTARYEAWLKRVAYSSFYRLLRFLSNVDLPSDAGDFALFPERNRFVRGLRAWIGFRQTALPMPDPCVRPV